MKARLSILMTILLVLAMDVAAEAKLIILDIAENGVVYAVHDTVVETEGRCKTVVGGYGYPNGLQTEYGRASMLLLVNKVCCDSQTVTCLRISYRDANNRALHDIEVAKFLKIPIKPSPGSVGEKLIIKVCSPGFGSGGK